MCSPLPVVTHTHTYIHLYYTHRLISTTAGMDSLAIYCILLDDGDDKDERRKGGGRGRPCDERI